ncbi:hypothetical protein [Streptomyces sp. NPDC018059]|uniref:hypothetical protein n=1 Tax=Streptomyces sp. NPDC018059 TaxID=3365041 RepID=UPI00379AE1A1
MAIEWDRVGQPGFGRIVEALVHRMYDASALVEVVNGRGGDAGIDIKVTHQSRVRIFQLKYYLDGFPTASFKGRRKSIKGSFTRAMEHQPYEWALVVPSTLSPAEREFVMSLAAGQTVRVQVWDRAKLDGLMATHADLETSFNRNQLFEAAQIYGQEKALVPMQASLGAANCRLNQRRCAKRQRRRCSSSRTWRRCSDTASSTSPSLTS